MEKDMKLEIAHVFAVAALLVGVLMLVLAVLNGVLFALVGVTFLYSSEAAVGIGFILTMIGALGKAMVHDFREGW